jgi:hypothetical protein
MSPHYPRSVVGSATSPKTPPCCHTCRCGQVTFGVDAEWALAAYWIARLGLTGLEGRRPSQLSGGRRRRLAIARNPPLMLLDEPFTGLGRWWPDQVKHGSSAVLVVVSTPSSPTGWPW